MLLIFLSVHSGPKAVYAKGIKLQGFFLEMWILNGKITCVTMEIWLLFGGDTSGCPGTLKKINLCVLIISSQWGLASFFSYSETLRCYCL